MQRVAAALQAWAHPHAPVMLQDAARTAQQAADALGVALGQIAKSIIFRRLHDSTAVLVITSGDRRVDETKVAALVGKLGRADAEFVKEKTGYSIGGVPPVAHAVAPVTLIDRDLFRFEEIWAAAGHPHGVFKLRPGDLVRLSGAPVVDLVQFAEVAQSRSAQVPLVATKSEAVLSILARATGQNVPSPCTSVCRIDEDSGLCEGCFRTVEEICRWSGLDSDDKRAVWELIEQRAKGAHS